MTNSLSKYASVAVLVLTGLSATACTGPNSAKHAVTAQGNHPITIKQVSDSLEIETLKTSGKLSEDQKAQLAGYAYSYKIRGHGPLIVSVPKGSKNSGAARATAKKVMQALGDTGIDQANIKLASYDGDPASAQPVTINFNRFAASAKPCGDWSKDFTKSRSNSLSPDFGCSQQRNMAAMISDPYDLVDPGQLGPADAARRTIAYQKYRFGIGTAAVRSSDEKADSAQ